MHKFLKSLTERPLLLCLIAAGMFLGAPAAARAQVSYTSAYLTDLNYNTQYPCGDPTETTPTGQIATNFKQVQFYGAGGVVDWTCYQSNFTITADIFSSVTANILIWGGEHTITVNANATIPGNIMICFGPGGSIVAGGSFTLTNNSAPCFGGGSGAGLREVGYQPDNTVFCSVANSPVTASNQPGPLAPGLCVEPAGYALMGPRPAVPGAAAITQYSVPESFHDPTNVTAFTLSGIYTLPGNTNAGDHVGLLLGCSGVDVNVGTPTITDSQGNSWPTFRANGPDGQALSGAIAGGPLTSISATLSYGVGAACPDLVVWAFEATNLTGVIDNAVNGRLIESGGTFANTVNFSNSNDLLMFQTETNDTIPPTIGIGPPPINQDQSLGNSTFGQAKFGDSFTTGPGAYGASVTVSGGSGFGASFFMVGYETGGTFNLEGPWTSRTITCADLSIAIASYICSPFIVLNDQPNTYTSSSGLQDFTLASHFYFPNSPGASAVHFGEISEDTTAEQDVIYISGGSAWVATFAVGFNPTNGDCPELENAGGILRIIDSGSPCGSGGGNTTSAAMTTNFLPKATGAHAIGNSLLSDNGTALTYTGTGGFVVPEITYSSIANGCAVWASNVLGSTGAGCGSGGTSIFASYQFGTNSAIVSAGNYFQLTYDTNFTPTYAGSGTSGSPFVATLKLASTITATLNGNASSATTATTATNLASYPTLCSGGQFSQGLSSGSNNCTTPAGGGNVSNSGTPTAHELAVWVNATAIEGVGGSSANTVLHWNPGSDPSFGQVMTADIGTNQVTCAKMTVDSCYRTADIIIGDESSSNVITNAQLGPQSRLAYVSAAATIVEVDVNADNGTPNVIIGRNHAGTISNILSSALATAASGGIACSNTSGSTGINGVTTCSATLQNTSLSAGDYLELVSGTAGGTAKLFVAHVVYSVTQ